MVLDTFEVSTEIPNNTETSPLKQWQHSILLVSTKKKENEKKNDSAKLYLSVFDFNLDF